MYHGTEFKDRLTIFTKNNESTITLSFDIEALGYGAVLSISQDLVNDSLNHFLHKMNGMTQHSLEYYSDQWNFLPQVMILNNDSNTVEEIRGAQRVPEVRNPIIVNYLLILQSIFFF